MPEDQVIEKEISNETEEPVNTSLREELKSALNASKPEVIKEEKVPRARTETGKFAKAEKADIVKAQEVSHSSAPGADTPIVEKTISAPKSWSAANREKWAALPPEIQAEVSRREEEVHKGFTKLDEERNFGKQMKDVVSPYMGMLQAEGAHPSGAVKELLNTALTLRKGTQEQKLQIVREIVGRFGIDTSKLNETQSITDPTVQALLNKVANLEGQWNNEQTTKQQQEDAIVHNNIRLFSEDTEAHPHFESVRPYMAALFKSGLVTDLQDAYDQAVYANPQIRATLLQAQEAEKQSKLIQENKDKVAAAKKAGSSIKGGPGATIPNKNEADVPLRDQIRASLRAATSH